MAAFMDMGALRAFYVVATELNMRRAAELLNISQPPLSRKIKNLEDSLGIGLFIRRSYGLELTDAGKEILEIVQPLLAMQENVQKKLDRFKKSETCVAGLTTAFEQGIYEPVLIALNSLYGKDGIIIKRASSVQLANEVIKGNIQAACVALPVVKPGLLTLNTSYKEPLLAVMPENWRTFDSPINIRELNNGPFFWFSAGRNPAWHEKMGIVFRRLGFRPYFIDEPLEYEVLLARIAAGEGWALIPESFKTIQRKGIKYIGVLDVPPLEMGIIYANKSGKALAQKCAEALKGSPRQIKTDWP